MEAVTIRAVVREIGARCVPARVQAVLQPSPTEISLSLGGRGGRTLLLSALPSCPSVHLAAGKPAAPPPPTSPFCLLVRRRIAGAVLSGVAQRGLGKEVRLSFSRSAAGPPEHTLAVELVERRGNVVLVDEGTGEVAGALRQASPGGGGAVPGAPYRGLPDDGRADLSEIGREEFLLLCRRAREEGVPLHRLLRGLGPGLQALASGRAASGGDGALFDALAEVVALAGKGETEPVLYPRRRLVLPLPVRGWEAEGPLPFDSANDAAGRLWREAAAGEERGRLTARVRRELARRRKRLAKRERRILGETSGGDSADLLQAAGRALLAALREVPRGAASFAFPDPSLPGSPEARVALDPALGPRANAEALFGKARKARRREAAAARQLPRLRGEMERVDESLAALGDLPLDELRRLAPEGRGRGRGTAPRRKAEKAPAVREYLGAGWRVLAGRSSRGNDYLTSRLAAPEDLWFHVRDYPGAHVVLKPAGAPGPPTPEAIAAAAGIAAWHSAARGESFADVAYAPRKHVRKLRGQAPGRVLLPDSRTVRVRPGVPEGFVLREGGGEPSVVK